MRLITEILQAFGNFATTSKAYTLLLTMSTKVIESMQKLVENCKDLPSDTISHIIWVSRTVANLKVSAPQVDSLIYLLEKLIVNIKTDLQLYDVLCTGNNLINANKEVPIAQLIGSNMDLVARVVQTLGTSDPKLRIEALKLIGNMFGCDNATTVMKHAITCGYLQKVQELLYYDNEHVLRMTLWGLSNFTAEIPFGESFLAENLAL